MNMGNSTRSEIQMTEIQRKYWCFVCQKEIDKLINEVACAECKGEAIQEITSSNDPRSHNVVTIQQQNNQQTITQPIIQNHNMNFDTGNGNMNVTITMIDSSGLMNSVRPNNIPNMTNIPNMANIINMGNTMNMGNMMNMGNIPNMAFDMSGITQNIQNLIQSFLQNGTDDNPATAQQLALLEMCQVQECSICQAGQGQGLKLGCQHVFHTQCVMPWLDRKNTCPTCRTQLKRT